MRRTLIMAKILTALCAVCLTVMLNWHNHDGVAAEGACQHRESFVLAPQHQHHHEATLTDASQIYRICSSRSQRMSSHCPCFFPSLRLAFGRNRQESRSK